MEVKNKKEWFEEIAGKELGLFHSTDDFKGFNLNSGAHFSTDKGHGSTLLKCDIQVEKPLIQFDNEWTGAVVSKPYIDHLISKGFDSMVWIKGGELYEVVCFKKEQILSMKTTSVLTEEVDVNSFKVKDVLHPRFWSKNGHIKSELLGRLREIANDFFDTLKINIPIKDIIFTGSLANYTWSEYSDIDLHVVIDFDEVKKTMKPNNEYDKVEFVDEYFTGKKELWNQSHDIKIYGFEVEVYVQNINEEHNSTGIYSIMNDEWIVTPTHLELNTNLNSVKRITHKIMKYIDSLQSSHVSIDKIKELKDKLKKMRKESLEEDGELGTGNLVYKLLRREGYVDKLYQIPVDMYDKEISIQESKFKK